MRALGLLTIAAAIFAALPFVTSGVQAQLVDVQTDEEGTVVQVGPDNGIEVRVDNDDRTRAEERRDRRFDRRRRLNQPGFADAPVVVSRYWIGVGGSPVPDVLRAQIDMPKNEGVLIRTVADGSPAAEAGVQPFDIVLRANGKPVTTMPQLAEEVGEQGEMKGRVTLDLLRKGQPKTLWVKPVERPADAIPEAPLPRRRGMFGGGLEGFFGGGGLQLGDDGFGEMLPQLANSGVSVSVARQNGGPAKVTVRQGEQLWEFDEGDQDALNALPADIRPTVERMLNQDGRVVGQEFEGLDIRGPGFNIQLGEEMAARVRELQERMRAMQGEPAGPRNNAMEPQIELDEAPAFDAPEAEQLPTPAEPEEADAPVEIEIPAVEE